MKIYPNTKVYIICPTPVQTGGPESLHQLASALISFGIDAYMVYLPINDSFDEDNPVHDTYKKYHVPYVFKPEDKSQNIIILTEVMTNLLPKNCHCVIWWMSVDGYLKNILKRIQNCLKAPLNKPMSKIFTFDKTYKNIEHLGQSEYVRQFLTLNGVTKFKTVETPMSQVFLTSTANVDLSTKKNIVAYNPIKGFEITKQLMELAPDIDWRPIQNMTPAQVQEMLASAKIYIDFGEFPGRERLPREAILSGCVVIVGKRGAAANDVDINIPDEFKFDLEDSTPYQVIKKIQDVFKNFERELNKQKAFLEKELNAQKKFFNEVISAFNIKNFPPPSVALIQGVNERSFLLAKELFKSKDFTPSFIVDNVLASTKISDELILREQNRNYLRVDNKLIELISRDDAKFLYLEGRIKKFALFEPTDTELDELKNFYEVDDSDVMIFNW